MGNDIQLLYVEDNAQDADLMREHITSTAPDFTLEVVQDGAACLRRLSEKLFDLVLLDKRLPDMDGLEVLAKLRSEGHALPVVMVTGVGDEDTVIRALRLGAADYVTKSHEDYFTTIPELLRRVLARERARCVLSKDGKLPVQNILYVEPNKMDVELTVHHFEIAAPHLHVHAVTGSRDALALLTPGHRFNLVLTDLRVPDMDALELIREAQLSGMNVPFMVITGRGDELSAVAALRLGAYDYLVKRKNYLIQLPHAIDHALHRFHLDQSARHLTLELSALNSALDHKVDERTAELQREIEVRKQAEQALRASERDLQDAQEVGGIGSYVFDIVRDTWRSSATLDVILGIDADFERTWANWLELVHPDHREDIRVHLRELIVQQRPIEREFRIVRANDGAVRWLKGRARVEFSKEGLALRKVAAIQDITEFRQSELELKLAAQVFEQSGEGFLITDANNNIVKVNHAFTLISGYSEQEVLGKNPSMMSSGRQDENFYRRMWEVVNAHGYWQGELFDRRKDGSIYPKRLSISRVLDAQGNVANYIGIFSDITKHKEDEQHIQRLAHYDALTGLPNRTLLYDRVHHAISRALRNHSSLAVLFMDIDHFKNVNDSLGHRVGDLLLIQVAGRMNQAIREEDTVARLGGDEFVLLLVDSEVDSAAHVAGKLLEAIARPYQIEENDLVVTTSIGIAMFPADGEDFGILSKRADVAMYRAKRSGRNNFQFFTAEMQESSERRLKLENALRHALEKNQLSLCYQPQMSIASGLIVGAEALLRWTHPELGMVSPNEFIPIAEDSGQIIPIGAWVLRTAADQMKAWMNKGLSAMTMAVNISAVQFKNPHFPEFVTQQLNEAQLPPQYMELELTEGIAMEDPLGAIAMMNRLHERGVRMSIDDFGTGYSSLGYLKRFKIYKLKIDQSFVRDIAVDREDRAIITAIINLANSLGLKTIAEGVETEEQLTFLREQGCNDIQGYFIGEPMAAVEFEPFMRANYRG